jgi:DNA polymerase V
MFALVDCNNFYASCERVFRPELNGKPIVVLSNNDGCVIARSNEAKAIGIPMGAPAFKFKEIFTKNNVQVFSSNFALYGDMSKRVMSILSEFSPEMEVYSIDEAFLKFEGFKYIDLFEYGKKIRHKILKWTGIPVSIGFAETKTLAKVAATIAKKFPQRTDNVYIIDTQEKITKALKWLPIQDVWGIGRRHAKRLQDYGITTAFKFVQLKDAWIKKYMNVTGLRTKKELKGVSVIEIEHLQSRKSIATTRTFEKEYTNFDDIKERIVTFAVVCAEKLRRQHSVCNTIIVFLKTNQHKDYLPQYRQHIVMPLPYATNSAIEIAKFSIEALIRIYKEDYRYKKAGVIVSGIVDDLPQQLSIFQNSDERHKKLMKAVDYLNNTMGKGKIKLAAQDLNRTWKMHQEKLSPRYTTKIDEILKIKI